MSQVRDIWRLVRIGQTWTPVLANAAINAIVGWTTFRKQPSVPMWGADKSVYADLLGTSFFLPLITSLVASWIISRGMLTGIIVPIAVDDLPRTLLWFRKSVGWRSLGFGCVSLIIIAVPLAMGGILLGVSELSVPQFVLLKVVFAVGLGMLETPLIVAVAQTMSSTGRASNEKP